MALLPLEDLPPDTERSSLFPRPPSRLRASLSLAENWQDFVRQVAAEEVGVRTPLLADLLASGALPNTMEPLAVLLLAFLPAHGDPLEPRLSDLLLERMFREQPPFGWACLALAVHASRSETARVALAERAPCLDPTLYRALDLFLHSTFQRPTTPMASGSSPMIPIRHLFRAWLRDISFAEALWLQTVTSALDSPRSDFAPELAKVVEEIIKACSWFGEAPRVHLSVEEDTTTHLRRALFSSTGEHSPTAVMLLVAMFYLRFRDRTTPPFELHFVAIEGEPAQEMFTGGVACVTFDAVFLATTHDLASDFRHGELHLVDVDDGGERAGTAHTDRLAAEDEARTLILEQLDRLPPHKRTGELAEAAQLDWESLARAYAALATSNGTRLRRVEIRPIRFARDRAVALDEMDGARSVLRARELLGKKRTGDN